MSGGSVAEFATISGSNGYLNQLAINGEVFETISEPYTDPLAGQTTELNEIIPVPGLVSITDTTASGLVISEGTVATLTNDGGSDSNQYEVNFQLPALGANVFTASVVSPGSVPASSLPAGDTNTLTYTLQPTPLLVSQPLDVVTDTLNEPAPQANLAVAPFSQVTLTDPNPLQLDSATISVTSQVPYTLTLPNLQDLSASALAAALDQVTLTFTSPTSGTDTVTATITDNAGLSTVLTTEASLIVTGALPPQPISASDAAAGVIDTYNLDAGPSANTLQLSPFLDVSIDDPNAGRLDSATITVSGPVAGTFGTTSLQNLPAAALAAALGADTLTFAGETAGTDTVTATITDSIGQTTTLTSTDGLAFTNATTVAATPIEAATITGINGTITGTAEEELLNSADVPVLIDPLSDAAVAIYDGHTEFDSVSTDSSGAFETSPFLPATGSSFTASVVPVLGSGPDTLALFMSERGAPNGAQFTVSVDGTQVGGVQTTTATGALPGQAQEFDVDGTFAAGTSHTVSIDYLNADQSLLLLNSGTIDGTDISAATTVLSNNGAAGFAFAAPDLQTIGSGAERILLDVSQSGSTAGAKFTVAVNGEQIGGVQTVYTAYSPPYFAAPTPNFAIDGNFPNGTDTITVTFLNANNSILVVTGAQLNGPSLTLTNDGSESDTFYNQLSVPAIGSGPDALELTTSQAGEPAGADFTVSVDGLQIGGVQTTTADNDSGQSQQLLVLGDFAPGADHTLSINYLNADNSLLFADGATINGATIAGGSAVLSNTGSLGFSFATPGAPSPAAIGSGPDTLALSLSEDYFQDNARFTLSVDDVQLGGVQTVSAIAGNGQNQVLDVLGNFAGTHTVSIDLLNPASDGVGTPGLVRNLYVNGASVDGTAIANSTFSLIDGVTSQSFTFTH